jgi:hypothetical protein
VNFKLASAAVGRIAIRAIGAGLAAFGASLQGTSLDRSAIVAAGVTAAIAIVDYVLHAEKLDQYETLVGDMIRKLAKQAPPPAPPAK